MSADTPWIDPGTLVTGPDKGYHILLRMDFREGGLPPVATYVRVLREDGTPVKSMKELFCDASLLSVVTKTDVTALYDAEILAAQEKRANLLRYLAP